MIKNTRVLYKFQCLFYFLSFEECVALSYKLNRSTGDETGKVMKLNKASRIQRRSAVTTHPFVIRNPQTKDQLLACQPYTNS